MRVLLDAHTLIWAFDNPSRLSARAAATIGDPANERFFSSASGWEIAIKVGVGKLTLSMPFRDWVLRAVSDLNAVVLPIEWEHAEALITLPPHHRDPFDRLIIAQAIVEKLAVISADAAFGLYAIQRIW